MHDQRETLISLVNTGKVFLADDVETHALSGVNLEIQEGEFVSVVGPSGCGKTTLLSILGLLDGPSSGEYVLDGLTTTKLSKRERTRIRGLHIGFIFQAFNLLGDLTVSENVELPLRYRNMPKEQRRRLVKSALEKVGMAHRANHFPLQLSGGQQQRVAVARAVVGEPSILLADEPTGNLDSKNSTMVMELLQQLHAAGATICMVTHDLRFADVAERRIQLFDGQIIDDDAPAVATSPSLLETL